MRPAIFDPHRYNLERTFRLAADKTKPGNFAAPHTPGPIRLLGKQADKLPLVQKRSSHQETAFAFFRIRTVERDASAFEQETGEARQGFFHQTPRVRPRALDDIRKTQGNVQQALVFG